MFADLGEVNGGGLADLVFTCEGATRPREGVVWLEPQRQGPWLRHSLGGPEGVKFDITQVLDLDGDGDPDVITCEEHDQLGVVSYENPKNQRSRTKCQPETVAPIAWCNVSSLAVTGHWTSREALPFLTSMRARGWGSGVSLSQPRWVVVIHFCAWAGRWRMRALRREGSSSPKMSSIR